MNFAERQEDLDAPLFDLAPGASRKERAVHRVLRLHVGLIVGMHVVLVVLTVVAIAVDAPELLGVVAALALVAVLVYSS